MNEADIGNRLAELRADHGWSQRELARRSNLTHGTISFIERNKISPSIGTLQQILRPFGLTLAEFFAGRDEAAPTYFFRRADLVEIGSGGVSLLQVGKSLS